jgi:hypothetical protein
MSWRTYDSLKYRLRSLLPSRLYFQLYHYRNRAKILQDFPEGITFELLNKLCVNYLGKPLKQVTSLHLSGWKSSGAFRLLLRTEQGDHWSLIYKNALYTQDNIPAVTGLPVRPGPPEFLVYDHAPGVLSKYLPDIYLCLEITPGKHYQYLLEDLKPEYRPVQQDSTDILKAAAEIPALHRAMTEWLPMIDKNRLLNFDRGFSIALLQYAREHLERYAQETADRMVSKVCELWPRISKVHQNKEFYELQSISPIHGDFNHSNIHLHSTNNEAMKIVDWEWAGMGIAHMDLVSLLKASNPEIEQQALKSFCAQEPRLSVDEHKRLYHWCKLERGLLDGAFLAKQQMESKNKVEWIPGYIRVSMHRLLNAYQELA